MILISSHGLYESSTTSIKDTVYFLIKNKKCTLFFGDPYYSNKFLLTIVLKQQYS